MRRKTSLPGPRVEALLDERDHLRIEINLADDPDDEAIVMKRRRLLEVDNEITQQWSLPSADGSGPI